MGKLNIAHHKSYHPYRRDNIERVRRDEETARLQQLKDEGKLSMADSEARLDILRKHSRSRRPQSESSQLLEAEHGVDDVDTRASLTAQGHINFFSALDETPTGSKSTEIERKIREREAEKGLPLGPSPKDLRPWYMAQSKHAHHKISSIDLTNLNGPSDKAQARDAQRKARDDPLEDIRFQLGRQTNKSSGNQLPPLPGHSNRQDLRKRIVPGSDDQLRDARISREASERARADALIRARNRQHDLDGHSSAEVNTPHSSRGYGNVYNKLETDEAILRRKFGGWRSLPLPPLPRQESHGSET